MNEPSMPNPPRKFSFTESLFIGWANSYALKLFRFMKFGGGTIFRLLLPELCEPRFSACLMIRIDVATNISVSETRLAKLYGRTKYTEFSKPRTGFGWKQNVRIPDCFAFSSSSCSSDEDEEEELSLLLLRSSCSSNSSASLSVYVFSLCVEWCSFESFDCKANFEVPDERFSFIDGFL